MAILNVSSISAALKEWYLAGLRTQINEETDPLWAELEKNTEDVSGDEVVMSLRYGRSGGVGARADDGDLPTANARKSVKARFKTKNIFARMQITTKAIKTANQDRAAFVNMLEQTLNDLMVDAKDDVQRQAYGNGTGTIAQIDGVAGTTLTLDTVTGLAEGMLIDIMTNANAVRIAGAEITSVDDDNLTIVVSSAAGVLTTDYIVRSGAYNLEMTGLSSIFAQTGSIYGLARATYPWLKATQIAINGEISEVLIQKGLDNANNRTGVKVDFLIGPHGVLRAWQNLKEAQRSTVNTVQLKGGWEAPVYQNGRGQIIPMISAKYAPAQTLRGISRGNMKVAWMGDWDWMDEDGAILSRVSGKAAYEATLEMFADICCYVIRGQVEYTGIVEH